MVQTTTIKKQNPAAEAFCARSSALTSAVSTVCVHTAKTLDSDEMSQMTNDRIGDMASAGNAYS